MLYQAMGPNVFVKEIVKENKIGDLYIPDSVNNDFTYGEVISVSDGYFDYGSFVPANVQPGDKIVFNKISGTKMNFGEGNDFIRVYMADILAKETKGEILNDEKEGN